jgi:acetyl-CoA acetyltransferase
MFRKEVTVEEVLASRVVCEPLHLWMLCSPNEGAAAVVLRGMRTDDGSRVELAAEQAYDEAGVGPDEIDVVECQDTDAARELLAWEELGLCARGAQAQHLADGDHALGGFRPVNPSGGLLSKGEPLGASALGQVVELVHQLRGTAGARQVEEARVGLAHTVGRGANASVVILKR